MNLDSGRLYRPSSSTDMDLAKLYLKKNPFENTFVTPKKKKDTFQRGDISTKMHTPAQGFESTDQSEVLTSEDVLSEEINKTTNLDEWAILTENEVKKNLYLKKLFKVVSSVRVGNLASQMEA